MDDTDRRDSGEPPSKKHKKHKKKHKHKRDSTDRSDAVLSPKTSIKLKLKIGKETMGTKNFSQMVHAVSSDASVEGKSSKKGETKDDDDISDEEKWLDALEKGNLSNFREIGKKDPSLLTARQKALLHGGQQDELLQLPSGYKTTELTEEQKQRRQEKAKRRRQQATEKMENDKTQTVHKLLKKKDSKDKRTGKQSRGVGKRANIPRITYRNRVEKTTLHFPTDVPLPFTAQTAKPYPEAELCGVKGCNNKKSSVCSKTKVPICGLQCYKQNLLSWSRQPGLVGQVV